MISHSPAPWVIDAHKTGAQWNVDDANGFPVALTQQRVNPAALDVERDANTKLIAAAPDLLAALITLTREESRDDDDPILTAARHQAHAAIAKATS